MLKAQNDVFEDVAGYSPMFAALNLDTRSRMAIGKSSPAITSRCSASARPPAAPFSLTTTAGRAASGDDFAPLLDA